MNEIKKRIDKLWSNEISVEEQHKLLESLGKDSAGLKSDLKTSYDLELSTGGKEITEKRFEHILSRLHARMDDQEIKPIAKNISTLPLVKNGCCFINCRFNYRVIF